MSDVAEIKKLMLRLLAHWGLPVQESVLTQACLDGLPGRPLLSDVKDARRELEADEFIQGAKDDLDPSVVTWTLTDKGRHKAQQLQ